MTDWLSDYVEFVGHIPADPEIHFANALWVLSACIGRHPLRTLQSNYYPNLSMMMLAESGESKTDALREAISMLPIDIHRFPNDVTPEELVHNELLKYKEGAFGRDEYSALLAMAQSKAYAQDLNEILSQIQDGLSVPIKVGRVKFPEPIEIKDVYVVFYGCTTPSLYLQYVTKTQFESGHAPRWLIILGTPTKWIDIAPPKEIGLREDALKEDLGLQLQRRLKILCENRPSDYQYSPEAMAKMNSWMKKKKEEKLDTTDECLKSVLAKWCLFIPHKLAIVFEVSRIIDDIAQYKDKTVWISVESVEKTINYIEKHLKNFKDNILPYIVKDDVALLMRAWKSIRKRKTPEGPVRRSDLYNNTNFKDKDRFNNVMEEAIGEHLLRLDLKASGTKKGVWYIEGDKYAESQWK